GQIGEEHPGHDAEGTQEVQAPCGRPGQHHNIIRAVKAHLPIPALPYRGLPATGHVHVRQGPGTHGRRGAPGGPPCPGWHHAEPVEEATEDRVVGHEREGGHEWPHGEGRRGEVRTTLSYCDNDGRRHGCHPEGTGTREARRGEGRRACGTHQVRARNLYLCVGPPPGHGVVGRGRRKRDRERAGAWLPHHIGDARLGERIAGRGQAPLGRHTGQGEGIDPGDRRGGGLQARLVGWRVVVLVFHIEGHTVATGDVLPHHVRGIGG